MEGGAHLEFLHLPLASFGLFLIRFVLIFVQFKLLFAVVFIKGKKLFLARLFFVNFDVATTLSIYDVHRFHYFLALFYLCYFLEDLCGKILFTN